MECFVYRLTVRTHILAPPQVCFDLARSIDAHVQSTSGTGERAIGGRTTGLIELGEEVTWQATHFGIRQRFTSRITQFERPTFFQDRMIRGAFSFFEHDHSFEAQFDGTTLMIDVLRFKAPFGPLGWVAERVFLGRYLRRFLARRAAALKRMAEPQATWVC